MKTQILFHKGFVEVPKGKLSHPTKANIAALGTIVSNCFYFGYGLSQEVYQLLELQSSEQLQSWYARLKQLLEIRSGDTLKINQYVVYQNFPAEVLKMSHATYWLKQICMYFGFDRAYFREETQTREPLVYDKVKRVLHLAKANTMTDIVAAYQRKPAAYTEEEKKEVDWIIRHQKTKFEDFLFRENKAFAALLYWELGKPFKLDTTTDILRFMIGASQGDMSLKTNSPFWRFSRADRKMILRMLSETNDLVEGVARYKKRWIRAFHALHVGDYAERFPQVFAVADAIRNGRPLPTFNNTLEALIPQQTAAAQAQLFGMLKPRAGVFGRRLFHLLHLHGAETLRHFQQALPHLTVFQLLKLQRFAETYPQRSFRLFAPKGNWSRLQWGLAERQYPQALLDQLTAMLRHAVATRLPNPVQLDPRMAAIKLPSNNAEAVTNYNRGDTFDIPANIRFIRTASYWKMGFGTTFFDNSWNFFDNNWTSMGACCWNAPFFKQHPSQRGAVFSGDPVSGTLGGHGAQLIDLYPDVLLKLGVRYAVWNILSYCSIPFDKAEKVFGILEMGEKPQEGKLLEPSRAQLAFPVTGNTLTKYVCYVDLQERKIVYLDANLKGSVQSALENLGKLSTLMPAIMEYLHSLPSVYDMLTGVQRDDAMPVCYDDAHFAKSLDGAPAYIHRPLRQDNRFKQVDIWKWLAL